MNMYMGIHIFHSLNSPISKVNSCQTLHIGAKKEENWTNSKDRLQGLQSPLYKIMYGNVMHDETLKEI